MEKMSESNKELLVQKIGKMYRDSMQCIKEENQGMIKEGNGVYLCLNMKDRIDEIVKNLRLEYAIIIQKEFLEENTFSWYEKYFTLEEYNIYKKPAIITFLHCLYG